MLDADPEADVVVVPVALPTRTGEAEPVPGFWAAATSTESADGDPVRDYPHAREAADCAARAYLDRWHSDQGGTTGYVVVDMDRVSGYPGAR